MKNKPETKLRHYISRLLKPYPITIKAIENSLDVGTPDAYFYTDVNEGWIEFKQITSFPIRKGTKIKIPFRPGQYAWIRERLNNCYSSHAFIILKISSTIFVFYNSNIQEEYTLDEIYEKAYIHSKNIRALKLFSLLRMGGIR